MGQRWSSSSHGLPVLEPGDHLDRDEFERRYATRPDIHKAELIQGVVYVAAPVTIDHGVSVSRMSAWLGGHLAVHPDACARTAVNGTVRLSATDVVQPDVMLWREGGNARIDADRYMAGAPELVVEVAASSATYDLHTKKESYRRAGVQEYIVWRTMDHMIDWFRLTDAQYKNVLPDEEGTIESSVFPGLRLNLPRMLQGDPAAILPPGMTPDA